MMERTKTRGTHTGMGVGTMQGNARPLNILVACEYSGRVRSAIAQRGHNVYSCDLLPTERPGPHFVGDVRPHLDLPWDMIIAFPPCTYLTRAGAHLWKQRHTEMIAAAQFVQLLANHTAPAVAIENPIGALNRLWRYPDQTVHPWWFGHPWTKPTCLWLKGLPALIPTDVVVPTESWNKMNSAGSRDRSKKRSLLCQGMAMAMAEQWTADLSTAGDLSTGGQTTATNTGKQQ